MDGGSTDGTLEMLEGAAGVLLSSERDKGLYDAINKGIARACGDVIVLLNDDDLLPKDALAQAAVLFAENPDVDGVSGQAIITEIDGDGSERLLGVPAMLRVRPEDVISGFPMINAKFLRRGIYRRLNGFSLKYKVASDRDFIGRCILSGLNLAIISEPLYCYRIHTQSLTFSGGGVNLSTLDEYYQIAADRLDEASDDCARSFYRTWLAWAAVERAVRSRRIKDLFTFVAAQPGALGPLFRHVFWHAWTRHERMGRRREPH